MNRRLFLKSAALSTFLASFPKWAEALIHRLPIAKVLSNPIMMAPLSGSLDFNGDDISRPHDILWNKDGYLASKGGIPEISEQASVVVVGGGVAGLSAAYLLRDLKPVLLEQAPQFGGNSKGEKIGETHFSIGAAYLVKPDEGSEIELLLKELGLDQIAKEEKSEDMSVFFRGQIRKPFWDGATDPEAAKDFQRVHQAFKNILENQYPDIPRTDETAVSEEIFNQWDSINFEKWMDENLGPVHPHVEEYLELYAWSAFCATLKEISAAQMLNFITSETDSILALPGGNAAILEKMYLRLKDELGESSLRSSCFVIDVTPVEGGVRIVYENGNGELKTVFAKACVFASPKFVASKVVTGLPKEQLNAISNISYRAYLVANVILNRKIESPTYELYDIKGSIPEEPRALNPSVRRFTDVCFGTWAQEPNVDRGVITVYKALPFDGARQFLFNPMAHDKNRNQIESQIPEILNSLGLSEKDVLGIRMTRWGHALPVASVGALASGQAKLASQTLAGKIVFANQDNWVNPSFEAAFATAQAAEKEIRSLFEAHLGAL